MHQHGVQGVADCGPLHFGVVHDARRHRGVGVPVNVSVADAHAAGEDGHRGVCGDEVNQARSAPGNQQVDVLFHPQQHVNQGAVGISDELHGVRGQAGLSNGLLRQSDQRGVGTQGFLAAAQDAGVAGFQGQGHDVGGYVGAAFVDAGDDAQGDAPLFNCQAVFHNEGLDAFAHRVGQSGDAAHVGGHSVEPVGGKQQPVQKGVVHAVGLGVAVVGCVGRQDGGLLGFQSVGDVGQSVVARAAGQAGQYRRGGLGVGTLLAQSVGGGHGAVSVFYIDVQDGMYRMVRVRDGRD